MSGVQRRLTRTTLEDLAKINHKSPQPHPIDPALLFDLVKLRRHVDEAITLAREGTKSTLQTRKNYKLNKAAELLSQACKLHDIAFWTVAVYGGAGSTFSQVASLFPPRKPDRSDIKYVYFFHKDFHKETIGKVDDLNSQMDGLTRLQLLNEIIEDWPTDPAPLRTWGMLHISQDNLKDAALNFTKALDCHKVRSTGNKGQKDEDVTGDLAVEDEPSSFESQLFIPRRLDLRRGERR
ncbi:hypothetical protein QBC35DRAFT_546672 [Podospora australis]|uniref:Uncharacterized protein n=1 Tax=Podospora australis TaxID=1536484 RepID=A0AAN6WI96_9PEZI|nr:hypothetical protein QBC35DRAFT_546672 [Podospora australis]